MAVKSIASTFVDFEGWVYHGMPLDWASTSGHYLYYKKDNGEIIAGDACNVRNICYSINQSVVGTGVLPVSLSDSMNSISSMVSDAQNDVDAADTSVVDNKAYTWCVSLLSRYKSGAKVTSSAYESAWKSRYWMVTDAGASAALKEFIEMSDSSNDILNNGSLSDKRFSMPVIPMSNGYYAANPFAISGNVDGLPGSYQFQGLTMESVPTIGGGSCQLGVLDLSSSRNLYGTDTMVPHNLKLSAMAIYNYLNSNFESSSIVLYSDDSSSDFVRKSHYSVNLVGTGIESTLLLISCISLIISSVVIGFYYSFGMILMNVKRGVRMIVTVPGAMLGSLASIARVVSYTVLMIVEIVASMFLYCLVTELLYSVSNAIVDAIAAFTGTFNTTIGSGTAATILELASIVIVIIFVVWFTITAIRLRKPIIKTFEEMADNVVQKFIVGGTASGDLADAQLKANAAMAGAGAGAGATAGQAAASAQGAAKGPQALNGGGDAVSGVLGMTALGQTSSKISQSKQKREARKAKQEAGAIALMGNLGFSGQSSAIADERNRDAAAKAKTAAKKQEKQEKATAGIKQAVGAAEFAAGAATGNVALAAQGMSNIAQGKKDENQAEINRLNNDAAIAAQQAQAGGSKISMHGSKAVNANKNNKSIQKMDLGKEAMSVAGAAAGGASAAGSLVGADNLAQAIGSGDAGKILKTNSQFIGNNSEAISEGIANIAESNPEMAKTMEKTFGVKRSKSLSTGAESTNETPTGIIKSASSSMDNLAGKESEDNARDVKPMNTSKPELAAQMQADKDNAETAENVKSEAAKANGAKPEGVKAEVAAESAESKINQENKVEIETTTKAKVKDGSIEVEGSKTTEVPAMEGKDESATVTSQIDVTEEAKVNKHESNVSANEINADNSKEDLETEQHLDAKTTSVYDSKEEAKVNKHESKISANEINANNSDEDLETEQHHEAKSTSIYTVEEKAQVEKLNTAVGNLDMKNNGISDLKVSDKEATTVENINLRVQQNVNKIKDAQAAIESDKEALSKETTVEGREVLNAHIKQQVNAIKSASAEIESATMDLNKVTTAEGVETVQANIRQQVNVVRNAASGIDTGSSETSQLNSSRSESAVEDVTVNMQKNMRVLKSATGALDTSSNENLDLNKVTTVEGLEQIQANIRQQVTMIKASVGNLDTNAGEMLDLNSTISAEGKQTVQATVTRQVNTIMNTVGELEKTAADIGNLNSTEDVEAIRTINARLQTQMNVLQESVGNLDAQMDRVQILGMTDMTETIEATHTTEAIIHDEVHMQNLGNGNVDVPNNGPAHVEGKSTTEDVQNNRTINVAEQLDYNYQDVVNNYVATGDTNVPNGTHTTGTIRNTHTLNQETEVRQGNNTTTGNANSQPVQQQETEGSTTEYTQRNVVKKNRVTVLEEGTNTFVDNTGGSGNANSMLHDSVLDGGSITETQRWTKNQVTELNRGSQTVNDTTGGSGNFGPKPQDSVRDGGSFDEKQIYTKHTSVDINDGGKSLNDNTGGATGDIPQGETKHMGSFDAKSIYTKNETVEVTPGTKTFKSNVTEDDSTPPKFGKPDNK